MRSRLSSFESPLITCSLAGHANQEIICICCARDCLTPLCQECIQIHQEYHEEIHQPILLKSLKEVQQDLVVKIKDAMTKIERKLRDIQNSFIDCKAETNSEMKILSKYRSVLTTVINNFFDELENDYKQFAEQDQKRKAESFDTLSKNLTSLLTELKKQKDNLALTTNSLQTLKDLYFKDLDNQLEETLKQASLRDLEFKDYRIITSSSLVPTISKLLKENVKWSKSLSNHSPHSQSSSFLQQSNVSKGSDYYSAFGASHFDPQGQINVGNTPKQNDMLVSSIKSDTCTQDELRKLEIMPPDRRKEMKDLTEEEKVGKDQEEKLKQTVSSSQCSTPIVQDFADQDFEEASLEHQESLISEHEEIISETVSFNDFERTSSKESKS